MTQRYAISGRRIFDGTRWHDHAALVVSNGKVEGIVGRNDVPAGAVLSEGAGAMLVPGFVDLQVNGGGSVLFNDGPGVETIRTICAAHMRFGTTSVLPTLITDTRDMTRKAIEAGVEAARAKIPGFAGIHLEGPHLSAGRKGAHAVDLIRPMDDADLEALVAARPELPALVVTCAPESVTCVQVARLAEAGIHVSLDTAIAVGRTAMAMPRQVPVCHASVQCDEPVGHCRPCRRRARRETQRRADLRRRARRPRRHTRRFARQDRPAAFVVTTRCPRSAPMSRRSNSTPTRLPARRTPDPRRRNAGRRRYRHGRVGALSRPRGRRWPRHRAGDGVTRRSRGGRSLR